MSTIIKKVTLISLLFVASNGFNLPKASFKLSSSALFAEKKRVVVVGNGMVGQRFMEKLIGLDVDKTCEIATFCEEPRAAYNRVKLTSYFETRNPSDLSMTSEFDSDGKTVWYDEN